MSELTEEQINLIRGSLGVKREHVQYLCNMGLRCLQFEQYAILRDESVPSWANLWCKDKNGQCVWIRSTLYREDSAPDLRPDEDGPITLVIVG